MKTIYVTVISYEPKEIFDQIKREVKNLGLSDYKLYIINNKNTGKGYAWAINQGLKKGLKAGGEIFIVANPDVSFKEIYKKDFLLAGKFFDVWGLAMRQDGKVYYGGEIDKWRMSGGLISKKPSKRFTAVDYVTGSFVIIKREVLEKIGFWDESYFLYYEDVDFCVRARRAGFKIGIDSQLSHQHFETSKINPKKEHLLAINRLKFFLRYSNIWQKIYETIRLPKTLFELFSVKSQPR